jgi:uncharacterized protein (TIGR02271 family)
MEKSKQIIREIRREEHSAGDPTRTQQEAGKNIEASIPVMEEHLNIDKKEVEKARYEIKKTVTRDDFSQEVPTIHEKVDIQRVEINQYVDSPPDVRQEGNTTIIPVIKEVVVVEKKLMLVEEIHITRSEQEVTVNVKDSLREEHVEINKKE